MSFQIQRRQAFYQDFNQAAGPVVINCPQPLTPGSFCLLYMAVEWSSAGGPSFFQGGVVGPGSRWSIIPYAGVTSTSSAVVNRVLLRAAAGRVIGPGATSITVTLSSATTSKNGRFFVLEYQGVDPIVESWGAQGPISYTPWDQPSAFWAGPVDEIQTNNGHPAASTSQPTGALTHSQWPFATPPGVSGQEQQLIVAAGSIYTTNSAIDRMLDVSIGNNFNVIVSSSHQAAMPPAISGQAVRTNTLIGDKVVAAYDVPTAYGTLVFYNGALFQPNFAAFTLAINANVFRPTTGPRSPVSSGAVLKDPLEGITVLHRGVGHCRGKSFVYVRPHQTADGEQLFEINRATSGTCVARSKVVGLVEAANPQTFTVSGSSGAVLTALAYTEEGAPETFEGICEARGSAVAHFDRPKLP